MERSRIGEPMRVKGVDVRMGDMAGLPKTPGDEEPGEVPMWASGRRTDGCGDVDGDFTGVTGNSPARPAAAAAAAAATGSRATGIRSGARTLR